MKPVYIPPEVAAAVVLTGAQAFLGYDMCNKLSFIMKQYDKELPKAVPMYFTATVILMAGKTGHHLYRFNRVLAKGKAIAEENRRLRRLRKRG